MRMVGSCDWVDNEGFPSKAFNDKQSGDISAIRGNRKGPMRLEGK
jgi:hypothetical protein